MLISLFTCLTFVYVPQEQLVIVHLYHHDINSSFNCVYLIILGRTFLAQVISIMPMTISVRRLVLLIFLINWCAALK